MLRFLSVLLVALSLVLPAAAHAAPASDARGFVDTIGVNTHLFYTDTVYNDYALVKDRLRWLGVRHIRDGMDPDRRQFFFDRVNDLNAVGIKSTMIACDFPDKYTWRILIEDVKTKVRSSVEAVEGVNEPDLQQGGLHDDGSWWNDARGCGYWSNQQLASQEFGPPLDIPVYAPSATGTQFPKLGDLFGIGVDGGNMHPYPGSQKPSGPDYYPFSRAMFETRRDNFGGRNVPVVATETGYHTAVNHTGGHKPVSERAAGIYMPRLFLEYAKGGVQRTFAYELLDVKPDSTNLTNEQRAFGLFRNDGAAKPSATALKNTIGFLDSPSKGPQTALDYTLSSTEDEDGSGNAGAVEDYLVQKADGSWWLALWQDSRVYGDSEKDISNPSNLVDITLPRAMNVVGYRPTQGTGSIGSLRSSSFRAGVGDDVLLLKLTD